MKNPSYTWTELYQAVLFELDLKNNQQVVEQAEIALRKRADQLRQEPDADVRERAAVAQALSVLELLKAK